MTITSDRADVARAWARALATTSYASRSRRETENLLRDLLDGLFDTLTAEEFSSDPAREIGIRLVAEHFTGEHSVSRTVEVLGQALLTHPELQKVADLPRKVVTLLGAVGGGHSAALRLQTLHQQEQVKQALLRARRQSERELQVSEAKFRELFASSAVGIVRLPTVGAPVGQRRHGSRSKAALGSRPRRGAGSPAVSGAGGRDGAGTPPGAVDAAPGL